MELPARRDLKFAIVLLFLLLLFIILRPVAGRAGRGSLPAQAGDQALNKMEIMAKAAAITIPFVKNVGQFQNEVTYAADLFAGRFFLTGNELVYSLHKPGGHDAVQPGKRGQGTSIKKRSASGKCLVFKEFFIDHKGARIDFKSVGEGQAETIVSYFKGGDPSRWRSGVSSYQGVSLGRVYPGIEVKLKASGRNVEKVFYVSPRGDVDVIRIGVAGVDGLKIAHDGRLLFRNSFELAMRAPVAWQEIAGKRCDVKVSYRLLGNSQYGFSVTGSYDKNHALIIDPDLDIKASTFLGGNSDDIGTTLVLDGSGNVYVSGWTWSSDFPTTAGAFDRTFYWSLGDSDGEVPDVFVSKLNGSLTKLLASTYLGGDGRDVGHSLALDSAGNVFLTGTTDSSDFPTTPGAFDQSKNGSDDLFVSKLDSNLTILIASTYLGGGKGDISGISSSLALDDSDNIYLAGTTDSPDYPTTDGAYDRHGGGSYSDAVISKLDGSLSLLLASTYLGGEFGNDTGNSLALDGSGNVYLTGWTRTADFPTTPGAYDRICDHVGGGDAFVSKLDDRLTALKASTCLGGSGEDKGNSLALDHMGNVYLSGVTTSTDFPATTGAYHQSHNGSFDVFVSKLNGKLTWLVASTYLGGSQMEYELHMALDDTGNVYLTGFTESTDFPVTSGSYIGGKTDIFFSKLSCDLTKLLLSSYLGGSDAHNSTGGYENGRSLALDGMGNVFMAGTTSSSDFPTTAGAYDRTYNNYYYNEADAFIVKLHAPSIAVISPNGGESWLEGETQNIVWETIGTIDNVKIEYSLDNGARWIEVAAATANYGIYPWTVPATPSSRCLVRISNAATAAISDTSDATFSICTPGTMSSIAVISPNGGESWMAGTTWNIVWKTTGLIADVKIEYSLDGGAHWIEVIAATANRGNYPWTVPATPSSRCLVRSSDVANAAVSDVSDAVFSILLDLDLQVERREIKAFSISRHYGWIQFLGGDPGTAVAQYRLLRRRGAGEFVLICTITPSELHDNQFQMQDKYLEKDIPYTYRLEAFDSDGKLIGISSEKNI